MSIYECYTTHIDTATGDIQVMSEIIMAFGSEVLLHEGKHVIGL